MVKKFGFRLFSLFLVLNFGIFKVIFFDERCDESYVNEVYSVVLVKLKDMVNEVNIKILFD